MLSKGEQLIEKIETLLNSNTSDFQKEDIAELLKEYKRNQKQLNKIIKINDRQQDKLKELSSKLSCYLSPQIYDSIFRGKRDVTLKSTRKKITVFFSDLVNFTQTTEHLEPEVLSDTLNNYLDEMFEIALQYGATIDKFIGDAIMVFFGDPESKGEKEDAINCVSMAIRMRQKVEELSPKWMDKGLHQPFKVRMGITTGYVTVGNFGSTHRMDYTAIGGQVNLASRLETNANANNILISHSTYSLVKDKIFCEKKGDIFTKGISYPIPTYEVVNFYDRIKQRNEINISEEMFNIYIDKDNITQEVKTELFELFKNITKELQ